MIKVCAAGVNRPDVFQRQGLYPPPPGASDIPGLEVAGEIAAIGENVNRWQVGDKVCALLAGGGYADFALAHQSLCLPVPAPLSIEEAAALPETVFTVCYNLLVKHKMTAGQSLLVHGGGSGIGTAAIQIAAALGIKVFITAGSDEKCWRCLELGASIAINYRRQDFVEVIKRETESQGVDVVLDMVGGGYLQRNLKAVKFAGRIIQIAFLEGSRITVDLMPLMLKQITLTGSTLRSRPVEEKAEVAKCVEDTIWPIIAQGAFNPCVHQCFPLKEAALAHELMERSGHFGKILLIP